MSATLPRRFGSYTLLRTLAEGGRGELLLALRNDNVGQVCAVKLLPAAAFADPAFPITAPDSRPLRSASRNDCA